MANENKNLEYLDDLSKYKVASGYPDPRGWEVIDATGKEIGKVDGLLSNKNTEQVVYLDVEVNEELIEEGHEVYTKPAGEGPHEILNKEGENHLILPIGLVKINENDKKVVSDQIDYTTFTKTKRFKRGDVIESNYEVYLLGHFTGDKSAEGKPVDDAFYDRPEFRQRKKEG